MCGLLKAANSTLFFFIFAILGGCQGASNIVYGARLPQKDKVPPNYSRIYDYSQYSAREKVEPWIVERGNQQDAPAKRYRVHATKTSAAPLGKSSDLPAEQVQESVEPELP